MATKRVIVEDEWKLLNKGGEVDSDAFMLKVTQGTVLIGTTSDDSNPPEEENCYRETEGIAYGGSEYVWAKSVSPYNAYGIIDKL